MTDTAQSARDDLAFMKLVVTDRGPLPWFFGAHLFAVGVIFGLNLLAGALLVLPSPIWSWLPASVLYVAVWFLINARSNYAAMGPSARVFGAAWMAAFLMTVTIVASLMVAQRDSGVNYVLIWPSIACALYGGVWMVGALIRRRAWMALVALGCFATAIACAALVGQPQMLLVMGFGLLVVLAAPGLVLMFLGQAPELSAAVDSFQIADIDEVIHGRVRLGVMAYLMAAEFAEFTTLKTALDVNEGTLSVHLRKLEEAGYVAIHKGYRGRRPLTTLTLTPEGRAAFRTYLDAIGKLAGLA